jgi:hypothetical protein
MKAVFNFDMSDIDDKALFNRMNQATDMSSALTDIFELLRRKVKYEDHTQEVYDAIEKIRDEAFEILTSNSLTLDNLYG